MIIQKQYRRNSFLSSLKRFYPLYLMFIPVALFYILFHYKPMVGVIIAFKNYTFQEGFGGSAWVGLRHFERFVSNGEFWRVFRNTLILAVERITVTFPTPILFALMLNEVRHPSYKKLLQTVSYLPHFVSYVVVYAVLYCFFSYDGLLNKIRLSLGRDQILFLGSTRYYRGIFVGMGLWKEMGWNAIIYLAALSRVNPDLFEAADIDGASKLQKIWHITLPAIRSIISIQFVRTMGAILDVSLDQTMVMNNSMVSQVADVTSYYIYKIGLLSTNQYSYSSAMGVFNSLLTLLIVVFTNFFAKKIDEEGGLW